MIHAYRRALTTKPKAAPEHADAGAPAARQLNWRAISKRPSGTNRTRRTKSPPPVEDALSEVEEDACRPLVSFPQLMQSSLCVFKLEEAPWPATQASCDKSLYLRCSTMKKLPSSPVRSR